MSSQVFTQSFSLELFQGIHDFRTDVLKIALYTSGSSISETTETYTTSEEVTGTGYTAGGATMTLSSGYPKLESGKGAVRYDRTTWDAPSTFTYRKALIYNSSKANRAIFVVDFGIDRGPSNGSHFIELPASNPPFLFMNRGV